MKNSLILLLAALTFGCSPEASKSLESKRSGCTGACAVMTDCANFSWRTTDKGEGWETRDIEIGEDVYDEVASTLDALKHQGVSLRTSGNGHDHWVDVSGIDPAWIDCVGVEDDDELIDFDGEDDIDQIRQDVSRVAEDGDPFTVKIARDDGAGGEIEIVYSAVKNPPNP